MLTLNKTVEQIAHEIAQEQGGDSTVDRIYFFPSEEEVRLVEIDPLMPRSERVSPYYFGAMPAEGIRFPVAIALIRPEEFENIELPRDGGHWADATLIWRKRAA